MNKPIDQLVSQLTKLIHRRDLGSKTSVLEESLYRDFEALQKQARLEALKEILALVESIEVPENTDGGYVEALIDIEKAIDNLITQTEQE
jgi:hypothetical protein